MPWKRKFKQSGGVSKKAKTTPLTKTQVKALVRRGAISVAEVKHAFRVDLNKQLFHNAGLGVTGTGFQLYTGVLYNLNGLMDEDAPAANRYDSRVGDEIYLQDLEMRFWLSNKLDRPNVMYRIIVFKYFDTVNPPTAIADVLAPTGNCILDYAEESKITVLRDIRIMPGGTDFSLEPSAANKEKSTFKRIYIPFNNAKIQYRESGARPKDWDVGVAVVCYDAYGSNQLDNIASFGWNYRMRFKDP